MVSELKTQATSRITHLASIWFVFAGILGGSLFAQQTRERTRIFARESVSGITRLILPAPDRAAPAWGN
jgi:hypothetical protein